MPKFDTIVIGAGIIGLATAFQLQKKNPFLKILVLEKESHEAEHQTGRNSGVIHSGMYYKPGSLKSLNCRAGKISLENFCKEQGIRFEICGKIVVATREDELDRMTALFHRGQENGVICSIIGREELREIEPHTAGIKAIKVPETGIVDYKGMCRRLVELIRENGGEVKFNQKVAGIRQPKEGIFIQTESGEFQTNIAVNCAGLYSDHVAAMSGITPEAKIIPFRGEYFMLKPSSSHLCKHLIYPVPDPAFPFLGVHFTRMIDGGIECGPNAVLAFAREGYRKTQVNFGELAEVLMYSGMRKIAGKYWRTGMGEIWRSISKNAFVHALQRLIPEITADELEPRAAGIRAQAITPDGSMVDDFMIQDSGRIINVVNAPSPAATASLTIGDTIAGKILEKISY